MSRTVLLGAAAGVAMLRCAASLMPSLLGLAADDSQRALAFLEATRASRAAMATAPTARAGWQPKRAPQDADVTASAAMAACVGVAMVAGAAAAGVARSRAIRRRAFEVKEGRQRYVPAVLQSAPLSPMNYEEGEKFLEERIDSLNVIMPMTRQEFNDETRENQWLWSRYLLSHRNDIHVREQNAWYKKVFTLRHRYYFEKMRLIKPLIMKYPTMAAHMDERLRERHPEEIKLNLDGRWVANEERVAGFTYEDWAMETSGGKFDKWDTPAVGDIVSGVVAAYHRDGCFVEIGAKTWAFMPLKYCSLLKVGTAEEAGLTVGDEIEVKVMGLGARSMIGGDMDASVTIVSVTELTKVAAWDEVDRKQKGETDSMLWEVQVQSMRPWGAVVNTLSGLMGMIPNRELADQVGNSSLIGQMLTVELLSAKRELMDEENPVGPSDFGLMFSYKNAATKELCAKVEVGQVLDAKVLTIRDLAMDVEIENVMVTIRKVDISNALKFEIDKIFAPGEEIKTYVVTKLEKSGEIRLSTRALEFRRGALLTNKKAVFERAEDTAKRYTEESTKQKESLEKNLQGILDVQPAAPPKKGKKSQSIIDQEDEDMF